MHILTANISKMVSDMPNITINKYEVECELSIGIFKFTFDSF